MRVVILSSCVGDGKHLAAGTVVDLTEQSARAIIACGRGRAEVPVKDGFRDEPKPEPETKQPAAQTTRTSPQQVDLKVKRRKDK